MSITSRREVVEQLRRKYPRAGRVYRRKLIAELCSVCGYERKYAIKLLTGNRGSPGVRHPGGSQPVYTAAEARLAAAIWRLADYPCGKRLAAVLPLWMPGYETVYGPIPLPVRQRLLQASPATLDRLLAPYRTRGRRRGGTRPGRLVRLQIPVRCAEWTVDRPGYLEADTVDHCGDSMAGAFMRSITYTDIYSGWVEQAAIWNKRAIHVLERTRGIEAQLPFPLLGFDSDNGGEFLNHHLLRFFRHRSAPVDFTRSRAYHKNDNAHVEQKNWSKVRQLLGYARYDQPELVGLVQRLYRNEWRLLQNFFQPVMKLASKQRRGSRVRKRYDRPQAPAQRLLAWKGLALPARTWIEECYQTLNPVILTQAVNQQLQAIRHLLREGHRHAA